MCRDEDITEPSGESKEEVRDNIHVVVVDVERRPTTLEVERTPIPTRRRPEVRLLKARK